MINLTVYGNLVSGKNSREIINVKGKTMLVLSADARRYSRDFLKQIPAWAKKKLEMDVSLTAEIYYQSRRSDVCDSLLCDLIQDAGIIVNDRQIRFKHYYGYVDKKNPRVELTITEIRSDMGTRHLIAVFKDGKYKLANYGQWDGYPDGQGVDILNFLKSMDRKKFESNLDAHRFISDDERKLCWEKVGIKIKDKDFVDMREAEKFYKEFPFLSRDCGSDILTLMQAGKVPFTTDSIEFAHDGLYCEYAYVIDLDKNTFEVFEGCQKEPLGKSERFYSDPPIENNGYYGVKFKHSFDLNDLPSTEKFLELTETSDDE